MEGMSKSLCTYSDTGFSLHIEIELMLMLLMVLTLIFSSLTHFFAYFVFWIETITGVTSYKVDLESKMVVVIGDILPYEVVQSVSKVKNAEIWNAP